MLILQPAGNASSQDSPLNPSLLSMPWWNCRPSTNTWRERAWFSFLFHKTQATDAGSMIETWSPTAFKATKGRNPLATPDQGFQFEHWHFQSVYQIVGWLPVRVKGGLWLTVIVSSAFFRSSLMMTWHRMELNHTEIGGSNAGKLQNYRRKISWFIIPQNQESKNAMLWRLLCYMFLSHQSLPTSSHAGCLLFAPSPKNQQDDENSVDMITNY